MLLLYSLTLAPVKKKKRLGGDPRHDSPAMSSADEDAKNKRARRFEKEQQDFLRERGEPEAGTSLFGRMGINGGAGPSAGGDRKGKRQFTNGPTNGARGFESDYADPVSNGWEAELVLEREIKSKKWEVIEKGTEV